MTPCQGSVQGVVPNPVTWACAHRSIFLDAYRKRRKQQLLTASDRHSDPSTCVTSARTRCGRPMPPLAERESSIDLLHLRALTVVLLERRQLLDVVRLVVVLDREAELDHAVDAAGKRGGLIEREARREQRRLKQEVDEVLDRLVALV